MIIISPGVYSREIDQSLYIPQLSQTIFGIVGTASKGPVNELTDITDEATLVATFGKPSSEHLGIFGAIRYLKKGKTLKFVRVAKYDVAATGEIMNAANTVVAANIEAVSTGSWGNDITVIVSAGSGIDPISGAATYKLVILEDGVTAEVFDLVVFDPAHSTSANYITTRINAVSEYIIVTPVIGQSGLYVSATAVTMAGGDDGAPADTSDYIGTVGTPPTVPATGLQIFRNAETVDVNMLAVPDVQNNQIIAELISICESRADCICLIDIPKDKTVQQAIAWTNGLGGGLEDPATAINSSYAAVYYPWLQVTDGYSNTSVWIPPSGDVAGAMAYSDYVADPWWAPAGLNRALLSDVLDIEYSATQGERDYMYGNGNIINAIINMAGRGVVIWGDRTAQRATTALDRIPVRRMLLYMRKAISTAVQSILFEPNDEDTWARLRLLISPVMEEIKSRRGITNYRVVCDETTNPAAVRAQYRLQAKIMFVPTLPAEMIQLDFVILNQQTQFSEV